MKKKLKIATCVLMAILLSCLSGMSIFAGQWKYDSKGQWYQNDDGSYLSNGWAKDSEDKWYYFNADGYLLKDTITPDGYKVGSDGAWIKTEVPGKALIDTYGLHTYIMNITSDSVTDKGDYYEVMGNVGRWAAYNPASIEQKKTGDVIYLQGAVMGWYDISGYYTISSIGNGVCMFEEDTCYLSKNAGTFAGKGFEEIGSVYYFYGPDNDYPVILNAFSGKMYLNKNALVSVASGWGAQETTVSAEQFIGSGISGKDVIISLDDNGYISKLIHPFMP